jgi:CBS domain containing-hemolysin-like protein
MTPIEKVFMLSTEQLLDDSTVESIMSSKPYSRLPIYRGHNKRDIIGWVSHKMLEESSGT